ncbi:hypothetical protein K1720_01460 [Thermococcus argininiproducens]|uniref:Uncharacterized protein n=1 Tax=Thermococcus argininiproducens TaxID=2866384 RepID=A0A9E7MBG0_9EURY|nr:hypothetical protein [Thermococcus argininiproducens]USH00172.1 hypothetical protein K1720_01460 [Thermococcus argininiproducens]
MILMYLTQKNHLPADKKTYKTLRILSHLKDREEVRSTKTKRSTSELSRKTKIFHNENSPSPTFLMLIKVNAIK